MTHRAHLFSLRIGHALREACYGEESYTLARLQKDVLAGITVGIIAIPLAMALATTIRPRLFSEPEKENGRAAWLLGASFISEGAIPFAAADPLRVIPSMMFLNLFALAGA